MVASPEQVAEARKRAVELMRAFHAGEIALDKALDEIVEAWTGQASRIVRVGGETHKPEVQT